MISPGGCFRHAGAAVPKAWLGNLGQPGARWGKRISIGRTGRDRGRGCGVTTSRFGVHNPHPDRLSAVECSSVRPVGPAGPASNDVAIRSDMPARRRFSDSRRPSIRHPNCQGQAATLTMSNRLSSRAHPSLSFCPPCRSMGVPSRDHRCLRVLAYAVASGAGRSASRWPVSRPDGQSCFLRRADTRIGRDAHRTGLGGSLSPGFLRCCSK